MIKIEMRKGEFIDMIKKMAIPIRSSIDPFLFPTIVLTVRPEGEIEWIGKFKYVTAWVRVAQTIIADISEPVQIPIYTSQFLRGLEMLKSKKNLTTFTHYLDQDDTLTIEIRKRKEIEQIEYTLRKTTNPKVQGILEEIPFRLEKDTDIILFKNGTVRPNISGSCDVQQFKDSFKLVKLIQKERKKEKKTEIFSQYNIYVDENLHQIKIVAGNEHSRNSKVHTLKDANVNGSGELHYTSGFAEVVNVLSGEIKFYAVDNGPLWIMQDTNRMKLRYLIAPTPIHTY
jgi:hypothetical protein